jgi:hypothetical protein
MAILSFSLGSPSTDHVPFAPPAYSDAAHVLNGCAISTMVYVSRFVAEHPSETARLLVVRIRNSDGITRPHTMALLTWRQRWWGRDEYFGVFPLDLAVKNGVVTDDVVACAERRLDRHSDERAKDPHLALPRPPPSHLSADQRAREVALARTLLPFASECFWVRCADAEIPLLFFRPAPGQIAVYDPLTGTAQAEVECRDSEKVVAAVADRLGYRVLGIRSG